MHCEKSIKVLVKVMLRWQNCRCTQEFISFLLETRTAEVFFIFSVVIMTIIFIITIIVTRTRPAFGRQGLVRIVGMVTSPGRSLFQTHKTDIRQTLGQTLRPLTTNNNHRQPTTTMDNHRQTLTSNPIQHTYSFEFSELFIWADLKQDRLRQG